MNSPELVLGTANFGLNYGVANQSGKLSDVVSSQILQEASRLGIIKIDTAIGYGDAENVIGNNSLDSRKFEVITKLPASVFLQSLCSEIKESMASRDTSTGGVIHGGSDI